MTCTTTVTREWNRGALQVPKSHFFSALALFGRHLGAGLFNLFLVRQGKIFETLQDTKGYKRLQSRRDEEMTNTASTNLFEFIQLRAHSNVHTYPISRVC